MNRHIVIAAVAVLCVAAFCTPILSDSSSAEYKADEKISDSGFVKSQKSLFYYAKFVCGFPFTEGSVSNDTPTACVGKTMNSNSVYVKLNGLDNTKTYKITVSEYASESAGDATASFTAKLDLKSSSALVWYSVSSATDKVYACGSTQADKTGDNTPDKLFKCSEVTFNGTFTSTVGTQIFKITLTDADGKSLSESKVTDIANFTRIANITVIDYNENYEDDIIASEGKQYGFTTSKKTQSAYANTALSCKGYDKYIWVVFITNVENPTIKVVSNEAYTAKAADVHTCSGSTNGSGYGCFFIDATALKESGIDNLDSFKVTIGNNSEAFATASYDAPSEKSDDNLRLGIGIGVACAIVIVAGAAIFLKRRS